MELLLDWTQHCPRLLPEHLLEVCCHVVPHAWPHNSIVRIVSQVHNLFLPGGPTLPWWMQWLGVFMYWSRTKLLCLWSGICKLIPRNCFITGLGLLQKLFHKPSQITIIILWSSCFWTSRELWWIQCTSDLHTGPIEQDVLYIRSNEQEMLCIGFSVQFG